MRTGSRRAVGLDIGGTKILGGVVDEEGTVLGSTIEAPTPDGRDARQVLHVAIDLVRGLTESSGGFDAIGIGAAGVISPDGTVFSATDAIANWRGTDLRGSFTRAFERPVVTMNDVHAAAMGEFRCGAGRGLRCFLMVTVGTGVGGAVCRDGIPDAGASGTAGSLGHIAARANDSRPCGCGQRGHVEAYASGAAMERECAKLGWEGVTLRGYVTSADGRRGGDAAFADIVARAAHILGVGLADAMNMIDAQAIVIGGGVPQMGPTYLDLVRAAYVAACLPGPSRAPIRAAELGTAAAVIGAGVAALAATSG